MTDVWTSVGVIGGVAIAGFTGWTFSIRFVAILVALNIIWTGFRLVRRSVMGLMDAALPENEQRLIREVMKKYQKEASTSMPCAHGRLRRAGSSRCMCSFPAMDCP
jgi:divalent metal cation (Fe/Co/Zn/Cd) transporter